jgi:predicted flap endonuclease-1-like 5' DNA nuclease
MTYLSTPVTERPARPSHGLGRGAYNLPISKLYGVPTRVRLALKVQRITTGSQLLAAAGSAIDRQALAARARIDLDQLEELVCRADMARVNGIGVVFGLMLEQLGVRQVADLAARDPAELHEQLRDHNHAERLARRSPTPEEVAAWVAQARTLPSLVA